MVRQTYRLLKIATGCSRVHEKCYHVRLKQLNGRELLLIPFLNLLAHLPS